jgi:hypothetical protein
MNINIFKNTILFFMLAAGTATCSNALWTNEDDDGMKDVLMLTVDYTKNTFKGGKELEFSKKSKTFTITYDLVSPCDFGHIKLYYSEIDELIFHGSIIWMGCGRMEFPTNLVKANNFHSVQTKDFVFPRNGFEDLFPTFDTEVSYENVWGAVQQLEKAREYLRSNQEQTVKMYLYTPSVGCGNPED